jgi:hypothetical protein
MESAKEAERAKLPRAIQDKHALRNKQGDVPELAGGWAGR